MQLSACSFSAQHVFHIVQCWQQNIFPFIASWHFILTLKKLSPVQVKVDAGGRRLISEGMKINTWFVSAVCAHPLQTQSIGCPEDSSSDKPEFFVELLFVQDRIRQKDTVKLG